MPHDQNMPPSVSPGRSHLRRAFAAVIADDAGVAALEFALLLPLLAAISIATLDMARLSARAFETETSAQAAAGAIARLETIPAPAVLLSNTIGLLNAGSGSAIPGLPQVDVGALVSLPVGSVATSRLFWGCADGDLITVVALPVCADGRRAAPYAEVTISTPVERLVAWPEQLLADSVEARALVRLG